MDKLLVTIYVPMIEQEYEVYLPLNKKLGVIRSLLIKSINELSEGGLNNNWNLKLYENDTGSVLLDNIYAKDSKLVNGSKLVLI